MINWILPSKVQACIPKLASSYMWTTSRVIASIGDFILCTVKLLTDLFSHSWYKKVVSQHFQGQMCWGLSKYCTFCLVPFFLLQTAGCVSQHFGVGTIQDNSCMTIQGFFFVYLY
jgi:hypothetical protein